MKQEDSIAIRTDSAGLAKAIFKGDISDGAVRALPAQSVYMAMQANGLEDSHELLKIITDEQYLVFLDFELWNKDEFSEERFWRWLEIINDPKSLEPLSRFLDRVDQMLLGVMIARNIHVEVLEEPTDQPPGPQWFTPDQGYTWIVINIENGDRFQLMGRMLALILQTSPERFYQLISLPQTTTASELEELSFQDKDKRLSSQGMPTNETASKINSPIRKEQAEAMLRSGDNVEGVTYNYSISPIVYQSARVEPLQSLVDAILQSDDSEVFEQELTLVANAGLSYYGMDLGDYRAVEFLIEQIKGSVNIGLEMVLKIEQRELLEIYRAFGVQGLYRVGLNELTRLRSKANGVPVIEQTGEVDESLLQILLGARADFPWVPKFFQSDGTINTEGEKLDVEKRAISSLSEIQAIEALVTERFGN